MITFSKGSQRNTQAYELGIGDAKFYISYETIVGAETSQGSFRRKNCWGPTTGRHMNDMGLRYDRFKEIDEDEMDAVVKKAVMTEGCKLALKPFKDYVPAELVPA